MAALCGATYTAPAYCESVRSAMKHQGDTELKGSGIYSKKATAT